MCLGGPTNFSDLSANDIYFNNSSETKSRLLVPPREEIMRNSLISFSRPCSLFGDGKGVCLMEGGLG